MEFGWSLNAVCSVTMGDQYSLLTHRYQIKQGQGRESIFIHWDSARLIEMAFAFIDVQIIENIAP